MQTEVFVAHAHLSRIEAHIFEYNLRISTQSQITAQNPRSLWSSCDLVGRETLQTEQAAFVQNADSLTYGIKKTGYGFRITDLFRNEKSPA